MREAGHLSRGSCDDPRRCVTDVHHADTSGEVDEDVPVDVRERRTRRIGHDDGEVHGDRIGDDAPLALQDLLRAGPECPCAPR